MLRRRIYKAICQRLKATMPQLEYIDLQKGQIARAAESYPIPFPSCLIKFMPVEWTNTGGGQLGETVISVTYYTDHLGDTFEGGEQSPEAIADLDAIDEVYNALQGFAPDDMNPLNRVTDTVVEPGARYISYQTIFKTIFYQAVVEPVLTAKKTSTNIKTNTDEQ